MFARPYRLLQSPKVEPPDVIPDHPRWMLRPDQLVKLDRAQFNLIPHRLPQPRTTRIGSPRYRPRWQIVKQLIFGHRSNSESLLQSNHAHPPGATRIQSFTRSQDDGPTTPPDRRPVAAGQRAVAR